MPYPETCPECAGPFRNTGTHFTARRNEVGRHVMLELGCQNVNRRFWWDFSQGKLSGGDNHNATVRDLVAAAPAAVAQHTNGHVVETAPAAAVAASEPDAIVLPTTQPPEETGLPHEVMESPSPATFLRQLELDRLTLRQMRGWMVSEEARRAADVAASATEAAYERLAIALFGRTLLELLGPTRASVVATTTPSAEERLEQQREKARIRARQRRAALKLAREQAG